MRGEWIINLGKRIIGGKISLYEAVSFFFARFLPKPTNISFWGVDFTGADHNLWSLIADIFINREYAPPGFEIDSNDIVVDIGAHKGVFTAYAGTKTSNTILAFEPHPENFNHLKSFVDAHKWQNVIIKNLAISQVEGEVELFTGKSSSRNTIIGKDVVTMEELDNSISVPSTTLDKAIAELPDVDFLKMDCEGAEFSILLNCDDNTYKKIKKLAIEYHAPLQSQELTKLVEVLESHYSKVFVKPLPGVPLGYIYARR